jgi:hypothetical protein
LLGYDATNVTNIDRNTTTFISVNIDINSKPEKTNTKIFGYQQRIAKPEKSSLKTDLKQAN